MTDTTTILAGERWLIKSAHMHAPPVEEVYILEVSPQGTAFKCRTHDETCRSWVETSSVVFMEKLSGVPT